MGNDKYEQEFMLLMESMGYERNEKGHWRFVG